MQSPSRLAIISAFAAVYLIWGSTYLGILFAIQSMPPLLMAGTRFFSAGVIMYLIATVQGARRSTWPEWRTSAIVGAALLLGGNGGVTLAEQYVTSGLAAVMVATVPIYIALLGWLTGSAARPTPIVWAGLAGGLAGVALLLAPSVNFVDVEHPHATLGMLILLFSAFAWSAGSIYSRSAPNAPSSFVTTGQQMLCGGALMIGVGSICGEWRRVNVHQISATSWGAWIYLVVIGAIVGYSAYMWLLRHCEPAKVATYAYVNPIVAVLLGAAFAGEKLALRTVVAAGLIIGSVALVITVGQRKSRPQADLTPALAPRS
ncbi:MAG: EamA family transporter [Verrucomicrobiota bacterium]|nr:EamA family transporter [Verrucomicrobiota bacterium]